LPVRLQNSLASASIAAECVSTESAAADKEKDDPQTAVISASIAAECASAASAAAAEKKDDPQAG